MDVHQQWLSDDMQIYTEHKTNKQKSGKVHSSAEIDH